jgi:transcriptional regulator with XRE-family HTH domain
MAQKLPNYLRTYRKRACLSQDEVAFLLGCGNGTKVSRYENFARQPSFETALAYQVMFGAPSKELFAGMYQTVEKSIIKRTRLLAQKLSRATLSPITSRKLEALNAIVSAPRTGPAINS